jgi:hypothetical protein
MGLRGDWDAIVEEDEIALLADVLGDRPPPALVATITPATTGPRTP